MLDVVNMPTVPHCARGVVATRVLIQDQRWAEIFVGRTEDAYFKALCVVGFNQLREPVTTSALLLPKEETVYVEAWAEVHHVRVTEESYSTRESCPCSQGVHNRQSIAGPLDACGAVMQPLTQCC